MSYGILYKDDGLDIMIELYNKRKTKSELNEIIEHYQKYGFYGNFTQIKL